MGAAAVPLIVAGTGIEILGQFEEKKERERAAAFNAAQADRNALALIEAGKREAGQVRQAGEELKGTQRVIAAKSGVRSTTGSVARVLSETERITAEDAKAILAGRGQQARDLQFEAGEFRRRGRGARKAFALGAAGTLIGGAGTIANRSNRKKKDD